MSQLTADERNIAESNAEEVKTTSESSAGGNDILGAALKYARTTTLGNVIAGVVILILALQLSGLSVGTITDKRFGLKTVEQEQTYQLQIKMFDLMEAKVVPKLDTLQTDVSSLRSEVASIKNDNNYLKNEVTALGLRVSNIENNLSSLEKENAIVHAIWRKGNEKN